MATIPARRKGACFLRIRENCPFRKLRKNRRYDVTTASSAGAGVRWGEFSEHPISASDRPMSAVDAESLPPVPGYQMLIHHVQLQGPDAMEMEEVQDPEPHVVVLRAAPPAVLAPQPAVLVPHPSVLVPHPLVRHRPADAAMEMDSSVDPETGERAQR